MLRELMDLVYGYQNTKMMIILLELVFYMNHALAWDGLMILNVN